MTDSPHFSAHQDAIKLLQAHDYQAALDKCAEIIRLDPQFDSALLTAAFTLRMLHRDDEAIAIYHLLIHQVETDQKLDLVISNLSAALINIGDHEEALRVNSSATLDLNRLINRGMTMLSLGEWSKAWPLYDLRKIMNADFYRTRLSVPHNLKAMKDTRLFITHEQGFGDSLMCLRYLPLIRPHVKELIFGGPPGLKPLVDAMEMDIKVVSDIMDKPIFSRATATMPVMDALGLFDCTPTNIPDNPNFNVRMRHILPIMKQKKIGLVWAGGARPDDLLAVMQDSRRSMQFWQIATLIDRFPEHYYVGLQQPKNHVDDPRIHQPINDTFSMLDTAALIKELDLVVTIDSSIAHLAGLMQTPVIMLSRHAGCWRWLHKAGSTNWYPSMQVVQQSRHEPWQDVLRRIDLAQVLQ